MLFSKEEFSTWMLILLRHSLGYIYDKCSHCTLAEFRHLYLASFLYFVLVGIKEAQLGPLEKIVLVPVLLFVNLFGTLLTSCDSM
jgi:hypothetical protein